MSTLILTLANKPALLLDALASVARQTRRDYAHIVHLDGGGWPERSYPPAVFFNRAARRAQADDYIAWLSDDDVWEPHYLATLAGYLDEHPDVGACYGGSRVVAYEPGGAERLLRELPALHTFDARNQPLCQIDGGQMLVRRSVLDRIGEPWVSESLGDCNIADGSFMNRVACVTPIVPVVGSWVMRNRQTPFSAHWRLVNGVPQFMPPDTQRRLGGG